MGSPGPRASRLVVGRIRQNPWEWLVPRCAVLGAFGSYLSDSDGQVDE